MKYPENLPNIIDVTKAPYYADNTGKTDCGDILRQVFDDLMIREIEGVKSTESKLHTLGENDVYIGFESRIENHLTRVIFPEFVPDAHIIYFPKGTYLVSDSVTYTHKNLKNVFDSKPGYELARGIHLLGECRDDTVIKLADNCKGFEKNSKKPVISFINRGDSLKLDATNVAQLNTLADLTVDCGNGNEGAVGIRFVANNSGRIENVTVKGNKSDTGIQFAISCEGVFRNISVSGFNTGVYAHKTSVCCFDDFCFSDIYGETVSAGCGLATFTNFDKSDFEKFDFANENGNYALFNYNGKVDACENKVYTVNSQGNISENNQAVGTVAFEKCPKIPEDTLQCLSDNYALVEDFGADGDGKTDSTEAIQLAFDSGKEIVLFSGGHYLVNGNITIPQTVKKIDFMFCDFFAGENLISGKVDALFTVSEDSNNTLFIEHLYTFEQFYGHFRLLCHAAKRDIVLKDVHTQTAAMYFNTVKGSNLYFDNCACTVGTYSNDCIIGRKGYTPEYCGMIPYEFHGQNVLAFNLNPERADLELLNDDSVLTVYGFKVEGPGTAIKTVNGGKTTVFVFAAGIGDITAENALLVNTDSHISIFGARIFGVADELDYNLILKSNSSGKIKKVYKRELPKITKYGVDYTLID